MASRLSPHNAGKRKIMTLDFTDEVKEMMQECENCMSETFTANCVDCGCNICDDCKIDVEGKLYCDLCNEKYFDDMM